MLELRHVCKRFKRSPAVDDVSFSARPGEITGYLGLNGSGKSTTMKMITGLMETTSGKIHFQGKPIDHDLIAYKQRIGYVPEEPHLYSHLSGLEYLTMIGQLRGLPTKATASCTFFLCMGIGTRQSRHIPKACGRKYCSPPHCCTIRICFCSTSLFPALTSVQDSSCAA